MGKHYEWIGNDLVLKIRTVPRASRDHVGQLVGDRIKIHITAPPVEGKANKYLRKFLSKQFKVAPSNITLLSGETHRDKRLKIPAPQKIPEPFFIQKHH